MSSDEFKICIAVIVIIVTFLIIYMISTTSKYSPNVIYEINSESLQQLQNSKYASATMYYMPDCEHCQHFKPVFEESSHYLPNTIFSTYNCQNNVPKSIESFPTVVIYDVSGEEMGIFVGAQDDSMEVAASFAHASEQSKSPSLSRSKEVNLFLNDFFKETSVQK